MTSKLFAVSVFVLSGLLTGLSAFAQSNATVTVPVTWTVLFEVADWRLSSGDFSAQLTGDEQLWYHGNQVQSAPRTKELEVGRRYDIVLTGQGWIDDWEQGTYYDSISFDYRVGATTTAGYTVYVEGIAKGALGSGYGYAVATIVVGPEGGCADCGPGKSYDLKADETRVEWSVQMGRSVNGEVIDPIRFASNSITSASFSRDELNFTALASDVERIPAQGALQQVLLPGALLNAVDVTDGFELRFFSSSLVTTKSGGLWQLQSGATPFVTYRFKSEDAPNLVPDEASFTRIAGAAQAVNTMVRNLSTGRWSIVDPATGTKEIVTVSANVDEVRWWNPGQNLVKKVTRTYGEPITGQRVLVKEVDGEGRESSWTYMGNTGYPGSTGKLNIVRDPQGGFKVFAYYNEAGSSVGQVHRIYRPYKDTPDGPYYGASTLQGGRWSEFSWAEDINNVGKLLASRVDRVGSTIVAQETGSHDSSGSANGRPLLTSTYLKYSDSNSGNGLTTIRQEYAEAAWIDSLYHGKPYAVVSPDRTQISWVQQRGDWSGSAFNPSATGTAWREVEIRGSADYQGGASQLTSYLGQTIRSIHVMPGNSTLTIRIRNNGDLIREELHICQSGNSFDLAGRVDREFSSIGSVKKETRFDPATSQTVVLYDSAWSNSRLDWERDSSGVMRSFTYDAKGRVVTTTTEGVGGASNGLQYSRTSTVTYDAADQVRQLTLTGGLSGTLVSKWTYDLGGYLTESGRPAAEKPTTNIPFSAPGTGRSRARTPAALRRSRSISATGGCKP